jgi:hypothetical protein
MGNITLDCCNILYTSEALSLSYFDTKYIVINITELNTVNSSIFVRPFDNDEE